MTKLSRSHIVRHNLSRYLHVSKEKPESNGLVSLERCWGTSWRLRQPPRLAPFGLGSDKSTVYVRQGIFPRSTRPDEKHDGYPRRVCPDRLANVCLPRTCYYAMFPSP